MFSTGTILCWALYFLFYQIFSVFRWFFSDALISSSVGWDRDGSSIGVCVVEMPPAEASRAPGAKMGITSAIRVQWWAGYARTYL